MRITNNDCTIDDFEIHVLPRAGGIYPVITRSTHFGEASGGSRLEADTDWIEDFQMLLDSGCASVDQLERFGALLLHDRTGGYPGLLEGPTWDHLRASFGVTFQDPSRRLQLRLKLEPSELDALPWEYLFDPVQRVFLATDYRSVLARSFPLARPVPPMAATLPLRGLLICGTAKDLDMRAELENIMRATASGLITWQVLPDGCTAGEFLQVLEQTAFDILHFAGHGTFGGDGLVHLSTSLEGSLSERELADLLLRPSVPRLVVLNACDSGRIDPTRRFGGLARRLLYRDVTAVVLMRKPVRDSSALRFTRAFYQHLFSGATAGDIARAVNAARRELLQMEARLPAEFGLPTVYLRDRTARLFDAPVATRPDSPRPDVRKRGMLDPLSAGPEALPTPGSTSRPQPGSSTLTAPRRVILERVDRPGQVVCVFHDVAELGRGRQCAFRIPATSSRVSNLHAQLVYVAGRDAYLLEDLASTNGTFVNGRRLTGLATLRDGDVMRLDTAVSFRFDRVVAGGCHAGVLSSLEAPGGSPERFVLAPCAEVLVGGHNGAPIRFSESGLRSLEGRLTWTREGIYFHADRNDPADARHDGLRLQGETILTLDHVRYRLTLQR